jgi:hypothetical protein
MTGRTAGESKAEYKKRAWARIDEFHERYPNLVEVPFMNGVRLTNTNLDAYVNLSETK